MRSSGVSVRFSANFLERVGRSFGEAPHEWGKGEVEGGRWKGGGGNGGSIIKLSNITSLFRAFGVWHNLAVQAFAA